MDRYEEIVKDFIDNYNFCTIKKEYYHNDKSTDYKDEIVANENQFLQDLLNPSFYYINGDRTKTFHNKPLIYFLENHEPKVSVRTFEECMSDKKRPFVLQMAIHPFIEKPSTIKLAFFDKLLNNNNELIKRMRNGTAFIFIYFGYEADNFGKRMPMNYHEVFHWILKEYQIPRTSITILSSNLKKNEAISPDTNPEKSFSTIYESAMELNSFKDGQYIDYDYSVDEYIENIKKNDVKRVLRMNRTQLESRDIMLYYLYRSRNINDSLVDHTNLLNPKSEITDASILEFSKTITYLQELNKKLDLKLDNYLEFNTSSLLFIKNMLPLRASDIDDSEKKSDNFVFSNSPIPFDVYKKSMISWVSTSLFQRKDQVFLNQSIFNPILNYHPLVIAGNHLTHHYLIDKEYKNYDWLTNNSVLDEASEWEIRLLLSISEIDKLFKMPKDKLINLIDDNHGMIDHNRQMLFECNSIRSILTRFHEITIASKKNEYV